MITGVLLARNEEEHVVPCLQSLAPHVDELILIDMESSDRTVEFAKPLVHQVLHHPLVAEFDAARNVAIDAARHEWLWFIDADERVPAETGRLVRQLVYNEGMRITTIYIPFKSYFCGKWIEHCGWWPGYTMPRVLKRGYFRFKAELHGGVETAGNEVRLPPDPELAIEHYSYGSVEHYVEKFNRYTSTEAKAMSRAGCRFDWRDATQAMVRDLWAYYERGEGNLDGSHGWVLSWLAGQYRWLSHAKLLDLETGAPGSVDSVPKSIDEFVSEMQAELRRLRYDRPELPLGIVWRSPIWDLSGYATDSRVMVRALAEGDRHLSVDEIRWSESQAEMRADERGLFKALCSAQRPLSSIAITTCIPTLRESDRSATVNVLRTTFETDQIPSDWLPKIEAYDEVWVWSEFNRRAFCRGWVPPEKIRVLPGFVDTNRFQPKGVWLELPESTRERFVFLSVLDWQLRKGWDVLVTAYCQEFGRTDGAVLLLKVSRTHGHSIDRIKRELDRCLRTSGQSLGERNDIVVWEQDLSEDEMAALYRSVDAFVLSSRGEGWGRPYLEAMASGLPVIGTGASGNVDFMSDKNSFLVEAEKVLVSDAAAAEIPVFKGHRWFEPNLVSLRRALQTVFSDPKKGRSVGRRAREDVLARFSHSHACEAVERLVSAVETRFTVPDLPPIQAGQVRLQIEGEFLASHSFAKINEELCGQFLKDHRLAVAARRVTCHPTRAPQTRTERQVEALTKRTFSDGPQVTIRHAYPPNWEPLRTGGWIHIQPWEFGSLPIAWVEPLRSFVDEIWAPSHYVKRVHVQSGIPEHKVQVIPWGIDPDVFTPDAPDLVLPTEKTFRFLFVGGTIGRKGFDVLLAAYLAEFTTAENVCLVVKDMGTNSFYRYDHSRQAIHEAIANPKNPEILYFDQFLTEGQLASLYTACHCLAAPYRGEGFGLPVLEAMACGLPPIVPRGGATDDFVTEKTGYLLDSREVEIEFDMRLRGMATQLKVELDQVRATLREAYEDRTKATEKGKLASKFVRTQMTWSKTARKMADRICAISDEWPSKGQTLNALRMSHPIDARSPNSSPRLSLCMIVRDSARTLGEALASIKPWVDEMIVVDTGSQDATVEIAREHGACIYHFPWCDDFSRARNESLKHATGDWLFWMDSDDTIDEANGQKLRHLIDGRIDPDVFAFVMQVHCPAAPNDRSTNVTVVDHVKLFRNRADLRFDGRIHEQVLPSLRAAGGRVEWTDIFVTHSGYDHTLEGQKKKIARDLRLLGLELAERPEHPFTLFNFGMTYADCGEFEMAIDYLTRSITKSNDGESHLPKAYALLVHAYHEVEALESAEAICRQALGKFPNDVELKFRLGVVLTTRNCLEEARDCFVQAIGADESPGFRSQVAGISSHLARQNLAVVFEEFGDLDQAEAQWREITMNEPTYQRGWLGLGEVLLAQGKREQLGYLVHEMKLRPYLAVEASLLASQMAEANCDYDLAVKELVEARDGNPDVELLKGLCRLLFEHGDPEAAERALQELAAIEPRDGSVFHNLGAILTRQGRFSEAVAAYETSVDLRPDSNETWLQLAVAYESCGRLDEARSTRLRAELTLRSVV